jgi:phage terminase large subunit GpA-like protein
MDSVLDPATNTVVFMKSSQVGASEILLNVLGYFIEHDPSPILMVQPTLAMAEAFSKDRISPMLRDSPSLAMLVGDSSRDASNTLLHKAFAAGHLTLAGANSPASLASRPIRVVLADEVDRYPPSAGSEGDPLALAAKRTLTFSNSKFIVVSSPTTKGTSRIESAFAESDQRFFYVPCVHCGESQRLTWSDVRWPDGHPDQAAIACTSCGVLWSEADRAGAVRRGEWRATKEFRGTAGFFINEIYSPWTTLAAMAENFLAAKPFPERLRAFVNTSLGQVWEEQATAAMEPHVLQQRAEGYKLGTVPNQVALIVAGADVQADRIEAYTWGFGEGEEAWLLDRQVFLGDPASPQVWEDFAAQLARPLLSTDGKALAVPSITAVDTGAFTQLVYQFCRAHGSRRTEFGLQTILAVKGQSQSDRPILGRPSAVDINWKGQTLKHALQLWPVGSATAKSLIYARLRIEEPGPGYVHLSNELPDEVFEQLTSERLVTKYVKGFARLEWTIERHRRNEALDAAVYAWAAAMHAQMHRFRTADWENLRRKLHADRGQAAPAETDQPQPQPHPVPARNPFRRSNGGTWVTRWRR